MAAIIRSGADQLIKRSINQRVEGEPGGAHATRPGRCTRPHFANSNLHSLASSEQVVAGLARGGNQVDGLQHKLHGRPNCRLYPPSTYSLFLCSPLFARPTGCRAPTWRYLVALLAQPATAKMALDEPSLIILIVVNMDERSLAPVKSQAHLNPSQLGVTLRG